MKKEGVITCDNCGGNMSATYYVVPPNLGDLRQDAIRTAFRQARKNGLGMVIAKDDIKWPIGISIHIDNNQISDFDPDIRLCNNCCVLAKANVIDVISTIRFNRGY